MHLETCRKSSYEKGILAKRIEPNPRTMFLNEALQRSGGKKRLYPSCRNMIPFCLHSQVHSGVAFSFILYLEM